MRWQPTATRLTRCAKVTFLFIHVVYELAGKFDLLPRMREHGEPSAAGYSERSRARPLTASCGCYQHGKERGAV